jgi:hypothetical protein
MGIYSTIVCFLQKIIFAFRGSSSAIGGYKGQLYFVEEIDVSMQMVVIRCRGMDTVIRVTFAEAIADGKLVGGMSSMQACMLGGYYGRAMRLTMEGRSALRKAKNMNFLLCGEASRYKIIFQNRDGDIGYFDQGSRKEYTESPLALVENSYIISNFDAREACYIGILAGINLEKSLSQIQKSEELAKTAPKHKKSKLRIVK